MPKHVDRNLTMSYPRSHFVAELRRLADVIDAEELDFQLLWTRS